MVRDLRGVIEREEAEMGIMVTLANPTGPMESEAAGAGFVRKSAHGRLPRLQVVSVADILAGHMPKLPPLPQPERKQSTARRTTASNLQTRYLNYRFQGSSREAAWQSNRGISFPVCAKKFPGLSNIFPDSLRREMPENSMRRSQFLRRNGSEDSRNRGFPCKIPCWQAIYSGDWCDRHCVASQAVTQLQIVCALWAKTLMDR